MKNNQNTIKATTILIAIFIMAISYSSCKKKTTPPPNPNEEELITTFSNSIYRFGRCSAQCYSNL